MGSCYVCKQSQPCCRRPLHELREQGHHIKFVRPIKGALRDAWGLGSVWMTCCGAIYGVYYGIETTTYQPIYLGSNKEETQDRLNQVKSFL